MQRWLYRIEIARGPRGWTARVGGVGVVWAAGPFEHADGAHLAVFRLLRRWQARARRLDGFVWLADGRTVGVALPDGVPVRAGLPFLKAPCSVVPTPGRP